VISNSNPTPRYILFFFWDQFDREKDSVALLSSLENFSSLYHNEIAHYTRNEIYAFERQKRLFLTLAIVPQNCKKQNTGITGYPCLKNGMSCKRHHIYNATL
jgi:hypothetical protein